MSLNARELKKQSLPYGRKKKWSISRMSDDPRMVVALRSFAYPRTQHSGHWALKVDENLFFWRGGGVEDLKYQGPCLFSDNGSMFVGIHRASNKKYPLFWP